MTAEPSPYSVELCQLCDQPWDRHVRLARADAISEMSDDDWLDVVGSKDAPVESVVTVEHCIWLLKHQNEGPMGPPGPMGAMGASGPGVHPLGET